MQLDSTRFTIRKRTKKDVPTTELVFDTEQIYKIVIDGVTYFARCTFPVKRTVITSMLDDIRSSDKPLEMSAITKMTFSVDELLRCPVSVKFLGEAPRKMSGRIILSPYQLLYEATHLEFQKSMELSTANYLP